MDREQIYHAWLQEEYEGKRFCDQKSISGYRQITDDNFSYFYEYIEYLKGINTPRKTIINYRSAVLLFLTSEEMNENMMAELSPEIVESYFVRIVSTISDSTYINRMNAIRYFLAFFDETKDLLINWDSLKISREERTVSEANKTTPLTANQISRCREIYRDDIKKLYIFEMFYAGLSYEELQGLELSNIDFTSLSINISGRSIPISDRLLKVITDAKNHGLLSRGWDIDTYRKQMKHDLRQIGIPNFKPKDAAKTRQTAFWKCPECGHLYEAVVDNWCAKQFTENGDYWIVCKERCGDE